MPAGWIARNNQPGINGLRHDRHRSDNRSFTNRQSHPHKGSRTNPCLIGNVDRACDQTHMRVVHIMGRGTQERILGDGGMAPNGNEIHTVTIHIVGDRRFFTHRNIPWRPDFNTRRDSCIATDRRSKHAQEHPPPAKANPRRPAKQGSPDDGPNHSSNLVAKGMRTGTGRTADFNLRHWSLVISHWSLQPECRILCGG